MRRVYLFHAHLLVAALLAPPSTAAAVGECGGETDSCDCGRANFCLCDGTCGNCVWHAWHMACCAWGRGPEWCTDAGTWLDYATTNGYPMGSEPTDSSIFVCRPSVTCSQWGHVGWVVSAYPDGSFDSTEQFWGGPCGTHERHREPGFVTGGFISNPDPDSPIAPEAIDDAELVVASLPAGASCAPGDTLFQTWSVRNSGTTTWTAEGGYALSWARGEPFALFERVPIDDGATVEPGQTYDWEVLLVAPDDPGVRRGVFQMEGEAGPFGDDLVVEVVVEDVETDGDADADADADSDVDGSSEPVDGGEAEAIEVEEEHDAPPRGSAGSCDCRIAEPGQRPARPSVLSLVFGAVFG